MIAPGRRGGEDGSITLELAILGPMLFLLLGLVVVAGRLEAAAGAVEQAAAAGARAASQARTASAAEAVAADAVRANLLSQGVRCGGLRVLVDTRGFRRAVGLVAEVSVTVRCSVPLADQRVPALPGSREVEARVVSPLDAYRGR